MCSHWRWLELALCLNQTGTAIPDDRNYKEGGRRPQQKSSGGTQDLLWLRLLSHDWEEHEPRPVSPETPTHWALSRAGIVGLADTSRFSTILELTTQPSDNEKGRDVHRWWGSVRPREGKEIDFKMETGKLRCSDTKEVQWGLLNDLKLSVILHFMHAGRGRQPGNKYRRSKTGEEFLYP